MPPRSATSARALTQGRVTASRRPSVAAQALTPAVLYARVSSKDQEKEGFSIPAQQKLLRAYAEERGFDVQREFTDVETAKRAGRTQFGQMLDWLKKHKGCRTILVEKTDRLYRNLKDYVVLEDLGLELHFVKEGSVISENARASDKLIHDIKVVMAKNYVANLSEETRKGMQEKAEQGIWPGPAPVGYRNVVRSDGKRIIDADPDLGPLVTRLFQTYVDEDIAVQALAQRAAGWGLRTPRSGKPLTVASLHYALNNLLYTGAFVFKGKVYPGTHPPLVPRELWDRVQDKLQGRATYVRREQKHDFPFSGLVRCGACRDAGDQGERLMVGEMHKARYIYYRCDGCKKAGRPVVYVRQERLDQAMSRALRTLRLDEEVLGWVRKALHQSHAEQQRFHTEALARLNRQIDQLQRRIDVAYEDRLDGRIPSEEFDRLAAGWRAEQRRVRRDMEAHERADHNTLLDGVQILELAGRAADLYDRQPPEERQKLLKLVISNSIWRDDNLEVVWQQPFDIIAESVRGVRENKNPPEANPGGHSEWLHNPGAAQTADKARYEIVLRRPYPARRSPPRTRTRTRPQTSVITRARLWLSLIGVTPGVHTRADLAAHLGVSRARVTQALAPLSSPHLGVMEEAEAQGAFVSETVWRRLTRASGAQVASVLAALPRGRSKCWPPQVVVPPGKRR